MEDPTEHFRADATASDDIVAIGGWECAGCTPPAQARWFAVELTRKAHPWVWRDGEPFRKIAGLELLASLYCVEAFGDANGGRPALLTMSGTTDNRGNSHVVARLLTTKFPLVAVLMQVAHTMHVKGMALHLNWAPRDQNTEADELANLTTHRFCPDKRVHPKPPLEVMKELIMHGTSLYEGIKATKVERQLKAISKRNAKDIKAKKKPKELKLKARDPWE